MRRMDSTRPSLGGSVRRPGVGRKGGGGGLRRYVLCAEARRIRQGRAAAMSLWPAAMRVSFESVLHNPAGYCRLFGCSYKSVQG